MPEPKVCLYEGMFLLGQSAVDLGAAIQHVTEILTRAEAEIIVLNKWDDRRMAYPIQGHKRGMYLLSYFRVRASQVANIERDCNLSEQILRAMVIKAEHMGETELELAKREVSARAEAALRGDGDRPERSTDDDDEHVGVAATAVEDVDDDDDAPDRSAD